MKVVTSEEMAIIDVNCEYYGLSRLQLMENAGKAVAEEVKKRFEDCNVTILAGTGNNGGDGFVAARFLKDYDVEVLLLGRGRDIRSEIARRNFEILKICGVKIAEIRDSNEIEKVEEIESEVIIDAMLGTGFKSNLRQPFARAIDVVNSSNAFVVAVDVPSGLNPDTGEYVKAVKANVTVTFHAAKPGLLKARDVSGEVVVADIGIPEFLERLCGPGDVKSTYRRFDNAHKGMHGRVMILGGGEYTGAPALAAMAAYAAGADIVTVVTPERIKGIIASFSPNLIVRGVKELSVSCVEEIAELAARHHVVVAGMGTENIAELMEELFKFEVDKAVLDAGALLDKVPENKEVILTPHGGEFRRVFGGEPSPENVMKVAKKSEATILLKGEKDVISDGKRMKVNQSGNAGMTVGGTGDVLAGICGAFLALSNPFRAACSAAFVNGMAGDMCFQKKGYNFTATDVVERVAEAIKKCLEFD
jgi:NAD(P)H-hydrate epimerase